MRRYTLTSCILVMLCGCANEQTFEIVPPTNPTQRVMPDLNQGISPSQRQAIMSGERPDWSDHYPMPITPAMKRNQFNHNG